MVPSSACVQAAFAPKKRDAFGHTGHAQAIDQVRNEAVHMRRERVGAVRRGLCRAGVSDLRRSAGIGTHPSGARPPLAGAESAGGSSSYSFIDTGSITFVPT